MRRRWMLAGAAMTAGCSVLPPQPYTQRRDWPLVVRRPVVVPARPHGRMLLVRNVQAGPGLEARGLQWLLPDGSVHVGYYEQWAVSPAEAVDDDLRQWLASSGIFAAVLAPGSRLDADLVLEGELNALIANPGTGTARVALSLVLVDQRPGTPRILLQKTESAEVKLAGDGPPAMVQGLKDALAEVLRRTEADVAAAAR